MSKAGHKSSKRGTDSCPLDLAKQKSLALSAVSEVVGDYSSLGAC